MKTIPEIENKYITDGGSRCPSCGSIELDPGEKDSDSNYVRQHIECNDCDASWIDVYTLTGIDKLEPGKPQNKVFNVNNIKYDTDGENIDLPTHLSVTIAGAHLMNDDEISDHISDEISNVTGFCHKGFTVTGLDT